MNPTYRALALAALVTTASACGGGNNNLPPPPPPPPPPPAAAEAPTAAPAATPAGEPAKAAEPVTLTPGAASPDPNPPLPVVRITSPARGQLIATDKAGDFLVKLDVRHWPTAVGGPHVHLIFDDRPYKAVFDPKHPVKLSELTGGGALDEGQHVLVAFPSRANHESVKTKDAISVVEFFVGAKKQPVADRKVNLKKPLLVYSRPKGTYKGEMANHVLIDFQLLNDTLGEGKDHVKIDVSGPGIDKDLTADVEKFGTPYYLDNLENGAYTVKLDLLDKDSKPVSGAWNSVTRDFQVDHNAPSDMPPPAAPAASDTGKKKPKK